jgi:hypothetical protein
LHLDRIRSSWPRQTSTKPEARELLAGRCEAGDPVEVTAHALRWKAVVRTEAAKVRARDEEHASRVPPP